MPKITVVTTTYNRKELLERLHASLKAQTDQHFTWVVVDDGSTDATEAFMTKVIGENCGFEVRLEKLANGGKCRALNHAFRECSDVDLFVVVDSDDYLLSSAIKTIRRKARQYVDVDGVGAICFRYVDQEGQILGGSRDSHEGDVVLSRYEYDRQYAKYDGCMSYFRRVADRYAYPEFPGETYIGPTVLQMIMAERYRIAFTNDVVGVAEYQSDGLSRIGRKYRVANPLGMIEYCGLMQHNSVRLMTRYKYAVMAQAYARLAGLSRQSIERNSIDPASLRACARPLGILLAGYWKVRYARQ